MLSEKLVDFIYESPSPYHVVSNLSKMYENAGFTELFENEAFKIKQGGRYFVTRNGSAIIAFAVPNGDIHNFQIVASHSDSPTFKVKNNPEMINGKYVTLNTEKYGGMIMHTWFDRPLSIAGRVCIDSDKGIKEELVNINRNTMIIPSLAIHMNRDINNECKFNAAKDTFPLCSISGDGNAFTKILEFETGAPADKILGTDIFLYNREKGCIWGENNEFVSAPKLDDLQCAFTSAKALIDAKIRNSVCVSAIFNNEEVGSGSRQGADSDFLQDTLKRIVMSLDLNREKEFLMKADSFMISADNAHALHPNYPEKADQTNRPVLNDGIVIKSNSSLKYTTDAYSESVFKKICEKAKVPYQSYFNKSDIPGGSTLGNISTTHVSIDTVDIGLPQLAMHSSYETAGAKDTEYLYKALSQFFEITLYKDKNIVEIL